MSEALSNSVMDVAFEGKKHGDTIKISIPKVLVVLNRIAGSYTMTELQTILA